MQPPYPQQPVSRAVGENWFLEVPLTFNNTSDFFDVLAETRSTEQINTFLIDQMAKREDDIFKFDLAWKVLVMKPKKAQIADFLSRLPGDRQRNLEQLAQTANRGSGDPCDEFKCLLVSQMTAEERKRIVPKFLVGDSRSARTLTTTLRELGHTDAEINAMLPKPGNK